MTVLRGVDVSEFTREISPAWWEMVRDQHGIRCAVIQAWGGGYIGGRSNAHFHQQVAGARAAGLKVAAYVWPPREWNEAINWIGDARPYMAFLALDVEVPEGMDPSFPRVERAYVSGVAARNLKPVIYTSPSEWQNVMSGDTTFGDLPLWLARYKWVAGPDGYYRERWDVSVSDAFGVADHVGGWRPGDGKLIGWQFAGTTQVGEETCDLNIFGGWPQEEEEGMASDEYNQLDRRLDVLEGWRERLVPNIVEADAKIRESVAQVKAMTTSVQQSLQSLQSFVTLTVLKRLTDHLAAHPASGEPGVDAGTLSAVQAQLAALEQEQAQVDAKLDALAAAAEQALEGLAALDN